jgi:hypothetical protein
VSKGFEEKLLVEAWEIAIGGEGEQLIGEIHEDAVVASGVVCEGCLELGGHQARVAGGVEEVVEASEQLARGGVFEDEAAADPAAERKEIGATEALEEASVAGEDDGEELAGIEVFAGEDAELVEDGSECFLGLVEDEDGPCESGSDVLGPASAQGLEAAPAVVRGKRDAEEIAELAVEIHGARLRVLDGTDDEIAHGCEAGVEQAESHAFSGAWVAGDHDVAAVGDAELDAAQERVDGGGW